MFLVLIAVPVCLKEGLTIFLLGDCKLIQIVQNETPDEIPLTMPYIILFEDNLKHNMVNFVVDKINF